MKKHLAAYLDNVVTVILLVIAGLTPVLFFNQLTEFYEMPKLVFLVVSTLLVYGLWIFSCIIKGRVAITRTPLDIPLLILLFVVLISTYFSDSRFASIYGSFPNVHGSAVSWVTYILLYFAAVSNIKSAAQLKTLMYVLFGSGAVVALLTLLSFFTVFLPYDFARAVNFTPTGSAFSTNALLLVLLPLPLLSLLHPNKYLPTPFAIGLSSLFGIVLILIGSPATYVALGFVLLLSLFVAKTQNIKKNIGAFMIPVGLTLVTIALAFLPSLPAGLNSVQQLRSAYPQEIQLPFDVSWKVSASAFRDEFFVGTGPSTYLFNFTTYKPLEFNTLPYWSFSFDSAYNEFLEVLATLGILGFLALLAVCVSVLNNARKNLSLEHSETHHTASEHHVVHDAKGDITIPAFAISSIVAVILLAIHATTLVSIVVTMFVFAALMLSQKSIRNRVMLLSMGINASTGSRQFDLFPIIIFIVFLIGAVPALYKLYNVVVADYYHRQALAYASINGTKTYEYLQKAETFNPEVDLYRVDMAQTNFALANALAAEKGPTQDNPEGSLTDQDRATIQQLLAQAIDESRAAVALNPRSSRNWEVLASIYRNISGVAENALIFSLDSYGQAIQRDPLNPALRINVGGIYYAIQNYDLAIRFFSDAANLKPDYANAYFNLAIALREKGDFTNAQLVARQTVNLLNDNRDSDDYKIAVRLLEDLDARVASGAAAPAAASESALQNPEIGDVNLDGLDEAPSVTPAPSVRPNPNSNLPQNLNEDEETEPSAAPAQR